MNDPIALGVDVGGTSVKAVLVDVDGRVLDERRLPAPSPDPSGEGVVEVVAELVTALGHDAHISVGVVVPGIVDETRGLAIYSANLGWRDLSLAHMLTERLQRPISFGHDVRAGARAEAHWGAAAGMSGAIAFVPIGTGLAAALLVNDTPVVAGGWAGEIGQVTIATGTHTGARVEDLASAAGIARRAGVADARTVAELVDAGDAAMINIWNDAIDVLADALAGMSAAVGLEAIILGGGVALAGDTLTRPLERALHERLGPLRHPQLRTATLGDRASALGATILTQATR